MYGLPKNFDIDFLLGQTLVQICFGLHDLRLNFDKSAAIHIESSVTINLPSVGIFHENSMPEASHRLAVILDRQVVEAKAEEGGCLSILFSGNILLKVHDSNCGSESYRIINSAAETIV